MGNIELFKKIQGTVFGLAIGDALGYPVEFLSRDSIKSQYGEEGIINYPFNSNNVKVGLYSDDTQMTLAVANSLLESKTDHAEEIMDNMTKNFIKWKNSPENNRAPGLTCMGGVKNLERGIHWTQSGLDSYGCGSAMRAAPIGIVYNKKFDKLKEVAKNSSIITHNHPVAVASAIANAYLVAKSINGEDPRDLDSLIKFTEGISEQFTNKLKDIERYYDYQTDTALNLIGEGWKGDEAVALAQYCVMKGDLDFDKTVVMAANTNGDSDSIASIAGGIVGSYVGRDKIPLRFFRGLENRELLFETSKKLYDKITK